jgi:hypothetical protein
MPWRFSNVIVQPLRLADVERSFEDNSAEVEWQCMICGFFNSIR